MRIGIIGAGISGRAPAQLAVQHGHDVMLSNSRDPATLATVMIRCKVGTSEQAAAFGQVVLLTMPFSNHTDIAPAPLAGKMVLDATNYNPGRDQPIEALINGSKTASELVAEHFKGAYVVKAFNVIPDKEIEKDVCPSGSPGRRALPIAGDASHAKATVTSLLDQLGFDVVDAGPLSEGWRFDLGQPAHGVRLDSAALQQALAAAGTNLAECA